MTSNKILTVETLLPLAAKARDKGQKLVATFGEYNALHIGHIRHLREARSLGDLLVVILAPTSVTGADKPLVPDALRAETLAHLDFVDYVCTGNGDLGALLGKLQPALYVARDECGSGISAAEETMCQELGIPYVCTQPIRFDSTVGINRFSEGFSQQVQDYLRLIRSRFSLSDVMSLLDAMSSLKVAVVGDTIIDEYCYCNILGASSKDPILALRYQNKDTFAGGIVAVANHVANFAAEVGLFTVLGDHDTYEDFIMTRLNAKITPHFMVQAKAPTVRKRRYIEGYSQNKLFEIYFMEDAGLAADKDAEFAALLARKLPDYDVVIVADFGHGAISPATRQVLVDHAPFLAVNAQANSGNRGFHTITKYDRADFVSIAEHELRLERRDLRGPVKPMIDDVASRMGCQKFVVTRGKLGSLLRNADGSHTEAPAFAMKVVDRIGAGDAFLSVSALAAARGADPELLCFVGNVVGALAVEILGNQKSIDRPSVERYATALLR